MTKASEEKGLFQVHKVCVVQTQASRALRSADSSTGACTNEDAVWGAGASALDGETCKMKFMVSFTAVYSRSTTE